jgi:hypothetical protein
MMESQDPDTFFGSLDALSDDKDADDEDLSHIEAFKKRKREARHERRSK